MSVTAPETEARLALKALLDTEFAPEGWVVENDRLHASLGSDGTRIGVYPDVSSPTFTDSMVQDSQIVVQFYGEWDKEVDNEQSVDPTIVETYAERFRRRLRTGDPNTGRTWFFNLQSVRFTPDPTGNITRFEATVVAKGANPALIETTG